MPGCADCRPDRLRESRRVERAPVFGRIRRGRGVATAGLHRTHHCDRPPNRGRGLVSSAGVESIRAETAEFHGKPHLLPFMDTRSSSRPHPGAARMALDPVGAGRRSFTGNVAVPRSVDQMVRPPRMPRCAKCRAGAPTPRASASLSRWFPVKRDRGPNRMPGRLAVPTSIRDNSATRAHRETSAF